jgi:aryl-alcohol dehydrogenase
LYLEHSVSLHYLAGFTCGVQTGAGAILNAMPVRPGSRVAIWGAGAVGLAAVMAAAASGAVGVVAIDRVGHQLALAAEFGATRTIDATGREPADVAAEIVAAIRTGVNVALDTTGNPAVIAAAVESLATQGTASVITSSGAPVTVSPGSLLLKGRSLRGSMGGHINPTVAIGRYDQAGAYLQLKSPGREHDRRGLG